MREGHEINQLLSIRCFARIVETGSFTKAADSLDMPKATVSKLIQDLEEHLGVQLLQRTTRRLTITEDGHAYYKRAEHLVRELGNVDESFSDDHAAPRGKIRVDIGGSIARVLVIPALPAFFKKYPGIQVELGIGDRTVDLIEDNVDCVVRGGTVTDQALVSRLLGTSAFVTCATPTYLAEFGTPAHPNDMLVDHRIVAYQSAATGRSFNAIFERQGEQLEIEAPYSVSVNDGLARLSAGLAGLGIIQTFAFMVRDHIARGQLIPILTEWSPSSYPFYVVYAPNRHLSNRVRVFIDWLVELFEGM